MAEKNNRVLQEMAKVMLHMRDNTIQFWAEAVTIACYTANRVFIRYKQRRYLMNCGLEESLILSALRYLTISITYSMMGKT